MSRNGMSLSLHGEEATSDSDDEIDGIDLVESGNDQFTKLTTASEWARQGTTFHPRTRADKVSNIPSGIYSFKSDITGAWWLERTASKFEFPFKVYNAADHVINRVKTYWKSNGGNLGILMNGLRGAGKTMTAQLLANALIEEENVPVLVVRSPIPLQMIFNSVQQHMIVIFDEFEKTHEEKHQQALLSTIDGMSRSSYNRMIIFTTNKTQINENFVDRPSRIHYKFEFLRVDDAIIEGLIDDKLPKNLFHLKPDIFEYLNCRKICTIDIVKAVIAETITFKESPLEFEGVLNIAKSEPPAYTVEIINPKNGVVSSTFSYFFRTNEQGPYVTSLLAGNERSVEKFRQAGQQIDLRTRAYDGSSRVTLLQKCEEGGMFLAKLSTTKSKTFWKDFLPGECANFWLDNKPEDWDFPFSPELCRADADALKAANDMYWKCAGAGTVYGTGTPAIFKIKITANRDYSTISEQWKPDASIAEGI